MPLAPWPYPKIVAHRGGGILAPENTLAAMRCGVLHGFRGVEFDVMLSHDQVPILMHDPQLGRTVTGHGCVADYPAEFLLNQDAGTWHSTPNAGEKIPRLLDVLAYCHAQQMWMNVEIKPVPGHDVQTGRVAAETVQAFFATDIQAGRTTCLPVLSSFSEAALQAALQAAPILPRGMLYERIPDNWFTTLQTLQCVALHCNHNYLSADIVAQIKAAGYWVFVYTVNDRARAQELFGWGVDGMVTDRLDLLKPGLFV